MDKEYISGWDKVSNPALKKMTVNDINKAYEVLRNSFEKSPVMVNGKECYTLERKQDDIRQKEV